MKIRRIHIENYRSIKKLTVSSQATSVYLWARTVPENRISWQLSTFCSVSDGRRAEALSLQTILEHDESRTVFISVEFERDSDNSSGVEKFWGKFQTVR